jgi:hypothetical protein
VGVGVGGVEDVLGELGAEAGHFFLDGLEAGLLVVGQLGAGEAEAAQLVVDDPLAGRAEVAKAALLRIDLYFSKSLRFCPNSA